MSKLIIAEKPSVAKSIASALGASSRADGFYEGSGLLVSWCVGHLVSPMDAGGYDERFKKWRYDDLPILPEPFRYVLALGKEDAFENLRALIGRSAAGWRTKSLSASYRRIRWSSLRPMTGIPGNTLPSLLGEM